MKDINPLEYLEAVGHLPDEEIDVAPVAICLAAVGTGQYKGRNFERYFHHLKRITEETTQRYEDLLAAGGQDDPETQLAALKHILADKYGYSGDEDNYNDLRNADLIAVIDRARGMPIALSLLYLHAGQAQGWDIKGISFPGHFLVRLERAGRRIIFDPFQGAVPVEAPQLRALLKNALGPNAELSSDYFEAAANREILTRLQNNIKLRQIEASDYTGALETIKAMRLVAPQEFRLLLDAGVLYSKTGQMEQAEEALMRYIDEVKNPQFKQDAMLLLEQVRSEM
jgi:regulator of sirC expression with transglutaminase-like and TPR domain